MKKVFIHIGPHKTGTSAIQAFLFDNQAKLSERGFVYDVLGKNWNNHHLLAVQFSRPKEDRDIGKDFIKKLLSESGDAAILISSEMLCESNIDSEDFMACFSGCDINIIGYLRHPCDLIVSAYNEVVRDIKVRRTDPIDVRPFSYDASLKSIIGRWLHYEKFVLCPYDPPQWRGGSLITDFMNQVGCSTDDLHFRDEMVNKSLDFSLIEVIRSMNCSGIDEDSRGQVISILRKATVPVGKYPLSRESCDFFLDYFRSTAPNYLKHFRDGFDDAYLYDLRGES